MLISFTLYLTKSDSFPGRLPLSYFGFVEDLYLPIQKQTTSPCIHNTLLAQIYFIELSVELLIACSIECMPMYY